MRREAPWASTGGRQTADASSALLTGEKTLAELSRELDISPSVTRNWKRFRYDFIASEADHPFIAETVNKARPGKGTYVALDDSDHGFRKTTSIGDSFKRWNTPGGEFNARIITTLTEWMEKVRRGQ